MNNYIKFSLSLFLSLVPLSMMMHMMIPMALVVKPSFLKLNQNLEIPSHSAINGSRDFTIMSSSGLLDVTNGNL